jgi:hypothetical protein
MIVRTLATYGTAQASAVSTLPDTHPQEFNHAHRALDLQVCAKTARCASVSVMMLGAGRRRFVVVIGLVMSVLAIGGCGRSDQAAPSVPEGTGPDAVPSVAGHYVTSTTDACSQVDLSPLAAQVQLLPDAKSTTKGGAIVCQVNVEQGRNLANVVFTVKAVDESVEGDGTAKLNFLEDRRSAADSGIPLASVAGLGYDAFSRQFVSRLVMEALDGDATFTIELNGRARTFDAPQSVVDAAAATIRATMAKLRMGTYTGTVEPARSSVAGHYELTNDLCASVGLSPFAADLPVVTDMDHTVSDSDMTCSWTLSPQGKPDDRTLFSLQVQIDPDPHRAHYFYLVDRTVMQGAAPITPIRGLGQFAHTAYYDDAGEMTATAFDGNAVFRLDISMLTSSRVDSVKTQRSAVDMLRATMAKLRVGDQSAFSP